MTPVSSSTMIRRISQDLFDETLLENQDLFGYTDDDAVKETISELLSQQSSSAVVIDGNINKTRILDHLTLTHPNSPSGKNERGKQTKFLQAMKRRDLQLAIEIMLSEIDYLEESNGSSNSNDASPSSSSSSSNVFPMYMSLVLQSGLFANINNIATNPTKSPNDENSDEFFRLIMKFALVVLGGSTGAGSTDHHPLAREIKMQLSRPLLEEKWFDLYEQCLQNEESSLTNKKLDLIRFARIVCNGCEPNKKRFVQAGIDYRPTKATQIKVYQNGLDMLFDSTLTMTTQKINTIISEVCKLTTILGKFQSSSEPQPTQDGDSEPVVSSAHANVKELYRIGAISKLQSLATRQINTITSNGGNNTSNDDDEGNDDDDSSDDDDDDLLLRLCDILSALRVLAIDNDIVQNMVSLGILKIANDSIQMVTQYHHHHHHQQKQEQKGEGHDTTAASVAGATLGLFRNLCANDEIKSTLCRTSLTAILQVMEMFSKKHMVQEHGCGILGAMALRQPKNANLICHADGCSLILKAMENFPNKVPLQRQGCLAIRNIASRLSPDDKEQYILDKSAENVLKNIASKHQGSIEESYAALRDLGITAVMYKYDENGCNPQTTQMFGTVKSNFRPVYE